MLAQLKFSISGSPYPGSEWIMFEGECYKVLNNDQQHYSDINVCRSDVL